MSKVKNINMDAVLDLLALGKTYVQIAKELNCGERTICSRISKLRNSDDEIVKENVKLAKQKQRLQDLNRIKNKSFRENARVENAVAEYNKQLVDVFTNYKLPKFVYEKVEFGKKISTGIIHITDVHFNELINLSMNRYDFTIASQRLKLLVEKSKLYFKTLGIKNVLVAITGDLMNSDRRLDELLAEATNRSKATFLAVSILEQMILDLAQDFNLTVANVVGNESRVGKDIGWEEHVASDNYDYVIYNILKLIFRKSSVRFLDGNSVEQVIEVAGQNILLIHGNQIKASSVEQSVQKIKGKYISRGIKIDYMLFGHLHSARIGDTYARGSSVCGANAFSDGALQLESRASQNIHAFYTDGTRDSIRIDLQKIDGIKGYSIIKELEAYNAKSLSKAKKKVTISKVVI